jgi:cellulose synthase (UDP-forming)
LGCEYIARTDNTNAKAGNLNNALSQSCEELVAFFDCDNVPSKNFLSRLVGFFDDSNVAMVISSLHYFNAQEQTKNIGLEMLLATDHAKALSNSQTGRDALNALLCFGTSYIVRRKPLEEIGGIPTETLCEDWATSIKLQALGYRTYFLDEVLSSGVGAENLTEFVQQRLRWCQGTLQSLYASTNPLSISGLNLGQRLVHLFGVFYYLMYPATLIALFIPLLYFFFGVVPIEATVAQFTFFFLPFFVMQHMMYISFSRRFSSLVCSQMGDFLMCFPLTAVVVKTFLKPFGKRFRVTKKGFTSDAISAISESLKG